MKKLLLPLLLLLAYTGFCQIDSAKRGSFNIGTTKLLVAGKTAGNMVASVKQLVDEPTLNLLSPCADRKVISFVMVTCIDGVTYQKDALGNKFSQQMIGDIQRLKPGMNLWILNVLVNNPDGTYSIIPGKTIRII